MQYVCKCANMATQTHSARKAAKNYFEFTHSEEENVQQGVGHELALLMSVLCKVIPLEVNHHIWL